MNFSMSVVTEENYAEIINDSFNSIFIEMCLAKYCRIIIRAEIGLGFKELIFAVEVLVREITNEKTFISGVQ